VRPVRLRSRLARWVGVEGVLEGIVGALLAGLTWFAFWAYVCGWWGR
jgi:hypothetical protein